MTKVGWKFLQTCRIPDVGLDLLRSCGEVIQVIDPQAGELESGMDGVHAIVAGREPITKGHMAASPDLKVIGRFGAGVDNLDIASADQFWITILNTPGANSQTVAEHTFALLLGITHQINKADNSVRNSGFKLQNHLMSMELKGKTLGIVGLGSIGRKEAQIGNRGFGMNILVHTRSPCSERFADWGIKGRYAPLEDLLAEADVITLHCPLTAETTGMINRTRLELIKPEAYLINTARGPLVDEEALVELLQEGRIRGAGLDVYAIEPPLPDNPLLQLSNVVLTPHMASNSDDAFARMATMLCQSIIDRLGGAEPINCVNSQVYGSAMGQPCDS